MTTSSTPPTTSVQRALELDRVSNVMLLENEQQLRTKAVPRFDGEEAPRGKLEAQLRACRVTGDPEGERVLSLELARIHFENAFDVDMAVQLLHRALEIEDDAELRVQLARQLAAMGRHIEAGHVLRDGEPTDAAAVFTSWLESGEAYARGGDAEEAVATFRETAMIAPDDPTPFARIASVAYWAGGMVPRERAADAWLEAAKRHPPGSPEHFRCVLRAFEVAPAYARSAETYTTLLARTGRPAEADEIWRLYAKASGHVGAVAARRVEVAIGRGDLLTALGAAAEGVIDAVAHLDDDPEEALDELTAREDFRAWLSDQVDEANDFVRRLTRALATPSGAARGEALTALSELVTGDLAALLLALAAEAQLEAGDEPGALDLARRAVSMAPWLTRAQSSLFTVAEVGATMAELEEALAWLPAHSGLFEPLAERCASAGRHDLALAYTRRVVELRPADRIPLTRLLRRAIGDNDAEVIREALVGALENARPWREIGVDLGQALDHLLTIDRDIALDVAGRVLSLVGPGYGDLYRSIRQVAAQAEDGVLELAATLGHAIGDEIDDEERAAVYLEAAELALAYGDVEAAAVHVSRAAAHSGPVVELSAAIDQVSNAMAALDPPGQSDARISLARAKAWAAEQRDLDAAVTAWRELAAMRWDLAADPIGAEEAFYVACTIDPSSGPYRYASDVTDRAGAERAVSMIVERAVNAEHDGAEPSLVAKLYAAAARIAADRGMIEAALDAAVTAVRTDPSRADAVAIVESIADGEAGTQALNFVYDTLADAALGRYGYRAAHYRAARQLEKHAAFDEALRHAINAFEAVPSVGASYAMLLRLAARAGNEAAAVNALTSAAAGFAIEDQVAWLVRAAEVAHKSGVGSSLQLELLLKAFSLEPSIDLVRRLEKVAATLTDDKAAPSRAVFVTERLERATQAALDKLEGSAAAEIALALAVFAASVLARPGLALDAIERAVEADPCTADYQPLIPYIAELASAPDAARRLIDHIADTRRRSDQSLAPALVELTSALHRRLADRPTSTRARDEAAPAIEDDTAATSTALDDEAAFDEQLAALEDRGGEPDAGPSRAAAAASRDRLSEAERRVTSKASDAVAATTSDDYGPASEAAARERGDHAAIAAMLAAKIAATESPDQRRLIRLRRAAVLEQRLGRLEEACDELERILEECGEDPTALRYLADLSERRGYHARGAKLWLRASQRASDVDEKIRDVVRCCEALVAGGRIETAQKLLEAARGLPQSPKLLRLRVAVARKLGDRPEVERAKRELEALGADGASSPPAWSGPPAASEPPDDDEVAEPRAADPRPEAPPEADAPAPSDRMASLPDPAPMPEASDRSRRQTAEPTTEPSSAPAPVSPGPRGRQPFAPAVRPSSAPPVSSRAVFRVTGVPPDEDEERTPTEILALCHREYLDRGPGGAREAKRMIRRLRSIDDAVDGPERDLFTFLLVEALDAAQGTGAANLALQEHWESLGGTPLVTMAVADRLVRRGDLKAALQLYRRVVERDLRGVRSRGQIALEAASVAWRIGNEEEITRFLDIAADEPDTEALALRRREELQASAPLPAKISAHHELNFHWDAAKALRDPSRTKTDSPTASDPPPRRTTSIPPAPSMNPASTTVDALSGTDDLSGIGGDEGHTSPVSAAPLTQALPEPDEAGPPDEEAEPRGEASAGDAEQPDQGEDRGDADDEVRNQADEPGTDLADEDDSELGDEQAIDQADDEVIDLADEEDVAIEDHAAEAKPVDEEASRPSLDVEAVDPSDDDIDVSSEPPPPSDHAAPTPSSVPPRTPSRPPSVAERPSHPPGHQTVEHVTSYPPAPSEPPKLVSVVRRSPIFPELVAPKEEELFDDLLAGDVEAGDELVATFGPERTHDILSVRRHQATLQRGDVAALKRLQAAAIADQSNAFARAVDHVISVFDPETDHVPAAPLNRLPAQPDNTKKLLFSWLDGTVNEALALVCESGMMRRDLSDYDLTGADRVPPVATTAVGRVYAAMTRLLDLGVRLFHRKRNDGALRTRVAVVSPPSAILEGEAREDSAALTYVVASALAAATPPVALVEALEEDQVRNIVAALRAGFGPVEESSVTASSHDQMRIAEDLWHMVPAAADRRLRTICADTHLIDYEIAVANGDSTRRRAGLFGCGDLLVAIQRTRRELDLSPIELDAGALRELCQHPAIADLFDLAILPEYAEARWSA